MVNGWRTEWQAIRHGRRTGGASRAFLSALPPQREGRDDHDHEEYEVARETAFAVAEINVQFHAGTGASAALDGTSGTGSRWLLCRPSPFISACIYLSKASSMDEETMFAQTVEYGAASATDTITASVARPHPEPHDETREHSPCLVDRNSTQAAL